jgi:hypothetical protein
MKRTRAYFVHLLGAWIGTILNRAMNRFVNALAAVGLAVALAGLAGCEPTQNPFGTNPTKGSQLGTSTSFNSSSNMPPPSAAGTVAGGTIDSPQSQGLSDYLKHHSLPLVGAQVVESPSGGKQVILFGFVASDFGKTDAEQKARQYLNDPNLIVDNRIKVSGELAGARGSGSTVNGVPSANAYSNDPYASSSTQDYDNNNLPPDAQAYAAQGQHMQQMQQYQQYNSGGSSSMMTMLLPLLMGGGGMTMGGGGFGGGLGGFGGGYPGFGGGYGGGYGGYPGYPPPMPNPGYGSSGSGFSF